MNIEEAVQIVQIYADTAENMKMCIRGDYTNVLCAAVPLDALRILLDGYASLTHTAKLLSRGDGICPACERREFCEGNPGAKCEFVGEVGK